MYALPPKPSDVNILRIEKEGCDHIISKVESGKYMMVRNVSVGTTADNGEIVRVNSKNL